MVLLVRLVISHEGIPQILRCSSRICFNCRCSVQGPDVDGSGTRLLFDNWGCWNTLHVLFSFFWTLPILSLLLLVHDPLFQMVLVNLGAVGSVLLEATRPYVDIYRPKLVFLVSRSVDVEFQGRKTPGDPTGKMRSSYCHVAALAETRLRREQLAVLNLLRKLSDSLWPQDPYLPLADREFMRGSPTTEHVLNWRRKDTAWAVLETAHVCFGCNCYQPLVSPLIILLLLLSPHLDQSSTVWPLLLLVFILNQGHYSRGILQALLRLILEGHLGLTENMFELILCLFILRGELLLTIFFELLPLDLRFKISLLGFLIPNILHVDCFEKLLHHDLRVLIFLGGVWGLGTHHALNIVKFDRSFSFLLLMLLALWPLAIIVPYPDVFVVFAGLQRVIASKRWRRVRRIVEWGKCFLAWTLLATGLTFLFDLLHRLGSPVHWRDAVRRIAVVGRQRTAVARFGL